MTDLTACANLNDYAKRALSLMDLTTLNDDDTDDKVIAFVIRQKALPVTRRQSVFIPALFLLRVKRCVSRVPLKSALQQ